MAKKAADEVFSSTLAKEVTNHITSLKMPVRESLEGHIRIGPVGERTANDFLQARSPGFPIIGLSHSIEPVGSSFLRGAQVNLLIKHSGTPVGIKTMGALKANLGIAKKR